MNFDFESDGETVNFPRSKFLNPSFDKIDSTSDIPEFTQPEFAELSLASLKKIMLSAQDDAISAINSLGIQTKNLKWKEVMLSSLEESDSANIFVEEERDVSTSKYIDIDEDTEDLLVNEFLEGICLRDYSGKYEAGDSDSGFFNLVDEHGIEKLILKRSYIWFLQNGDTRISNDRLKRFEVDEKTKKTSQIAVGENQKMDSVSIGDWCLIENLSTNQYVIGLILEFGYMNEKKK